MNEPIMAASTAIQVIVLARSGLTGAGTLNAARELRRAERRWRQSWIGQDWIEPGWIGHGTTLRKTWPSIVAGSDRFGSAGLIAAGFDRGITDMPGRRSMPCRSPASSAIFTGMRCTTW